MGGMKVIASTLLFLGALLVAGTARAKVVNVYTSANFAPLMLADGRGVYPDLVAWLNRQKLGDLTFQLRFLPRKRLQVKLEEGTLDGIVIGMMPEWLADKDEKRYLWTVPFASDRFALVSLSSRPLDPDLAATLSGRSVGTTMGYVYPGLDSWFVHARLQRSGGVSDEKNIEKLLLGRVDSVIVAESMARYFIRAQNLGARLRVHPMPGPATERRFLVQHRDAGVYAQIAPAIKKLKADPDWQRAAGAYQ